MREIKQFKMLVTDSNKVSNKTSVLYLRTNKGSGYMKDLIKITTNDKGQQLVSARELYLGLGLDKSHWKRWSKQNIEINEFFKENVDWIGFATMANGNEVNDYAITIEFAKHIAMMARTAKSHEYRNYFIECEK